jgi:hypothetical protein
MFGAYLPETSQIIPDRTLVVAGMLYHPVNTLKFNQGILRDMPDAREITIGYWVGQTYSRMNIRSM